MLVYNSPVLETWVPKVNVKFALDASNGIALMSSTNPESHGTHPHVWLDPTLAKKEVENIRDGLIKVDPANGAYYTANAKKFSGQLDSLDALLSLLISNDNTHIHIHNITILQVYYRITSFSI